MSPRRWRSIRGRARHRHLRGPQEGLLIGYLEDDAEKVRLHIEESFTLLMSTRQAVVPVMREVAEGAKLATG